MNHLRSRMNARFEPSSRVFCSRAVATATALLTLSATHVAFAGNDDENLLGTEAALTGGAVTATVSDGSAVYYNPAGIAAGTQDKLDVSGSAYTARPGTWKLHGVSLRSGRAHLRATDLARLVPGHRHLRSAIEQADDPDVGVDSSRCAGRSR